MHAYRGTVLTSSVNLAPKPSVVHAQRACITQARPICAAANAKQKAERPRRWNMMEYKYKSSDGQDDQGLEYLEVVCNPNAYATAFDAKVLITMHSSQGLKVTTEGRLSNLKGDVDTFLEQH